MFLQATALGLAFHQLAGFDHERLRRTLLPPGFEPGTLIAIGYPRDPHAVSTAASPPGATGRGRRPLADFVFGAEWSAPAPFVAAPEPARG